MRKIKKGEGLGQGAKQPVRRRKRRGQLGGREASLEEEEERPVRRKRRGQFRGGRGEAS